MRLHAHITKRMRTMAMTLSLAMASLFSQAIAECTDCEDCIPRVAIKSNLLHDAILTPDLGIEVEIAGKFSLSAEGVWVWWGKDSSRRVWRVAGGWGEMRYWMGRKSRQRALTGHHLGVYGSIHKYDFALSSTGCQSVGMTYGYGVSYGYSIPIGERLNLDLGVKIGYFSSPYVKYRPMCGELHAVSSGVRKYFGPTGIDVTLVWFPGVKKHNHPVYKINQP